MWTAQIDSSEHIPTISHSSAPCFLASSGDAFLMSSIHGKKTENRDDLSLLHSWTIKYSSRKMGRFFPVKNEKIFLYFQRNSKISFLLAWLGNLDGSFWIFLMIGSIKKSLEKSRQKSWFCNGTEKLRQTLAIPFLCDILAVSTLFFLIFWISSNFLVRVRAWNFSKNSLSKIR